MTQAATWSVPLVGPATPTVMAQRIDDSLDALLSGHSGASRPSYAVAGTDWQDTSIAGVVKYYHYDGSDDILLYTIDTTNNRVDQPPQPFGTVASAATTDIGAVTSQNVTVTGTATITSFGTVPAGTFRRLVFSGVLTLTHNATSLILPQGGNVVTAVGDSLGAVSLGSGNWRVTSYQRGSRFKSTQQTATLGGLITVAHGFGAAPDVSTLCASIVNTSGATANGYANGVEIRAYTDQVSTAANGCGVQVWADATNIYGRVGNSALFAGINGTTGVGNEAFSVANWKVYLSGQLL